MTSEDFLKYGATLLGGGAIGSLIKVFRKPSSRADIIQVAQEAARAVISDLRAEIERLKNDHADCLRRNEDLEARLDELEGRLPAKRRPQAQS